MASDLSWLKPAGDQLYTTKQMGQDLQTQISGISNTTDAKIAQALIVYPTTEQMEQAILASKQGTFSDGGSVATSTALPATSADFTVIHINDTNTNVYASNGSGSLVWIDFAPKVDLSSFASTDALNTAVEASLATAQAYTDAGLALKLDKTAQAADSAMLGGKAPASYVQTETDPTVPAWAKGANKPVYTAAEVGAVPTTRKIGDQTLDKDIVLTDLIPAGSIHLANLDTSTQSAISNASTQAAAAQTAATAAKTAANTVSAAVATMGSEGNYGEINTGKTFRGKPIFRQDFYIGFSGASGTELNFQLLAAGVVDTILSVGGMASSGYGTESWGIPSASTGQYAQYHYVRLNDKGALAYISMSTSVRNSAPTFIIVEYTKK